jgi:hypothetical protein
LYLLHSHYGINSTTKIKLKTITLLLIDAYKKDREDKLWQQWLIDYGRMDSEHFISFEDYKKEFIKPEPEKVDVEDVLRDAEKIKAMDQGS